MSFRIETPEDLRKVIISAQGGDPEAQQTLNAFLKFANNIERTNLPTRRVAADDAWRFDPPRALRGIALDHVFVGWDGRATIDVPTQGHTVTIEADRSLSFLVVYVPADRDFLAVEPVTHMTDAFNRAAGGEPGTGTRALGPGASYSCTMRITCAPRAERLTS